MAFAIGTAAALIIAGLVVASYFEPRTSTIITTFSSGASSGTTSFTKSASNQSSVVSGSQNPNCGVGPSNGDEWLTFKHDSQRTGYSDSNFSSPSGNFLGQLVWQSKFAGISEMVSAQHKLFAAEYELDALNSSNGALLWSVQTGAGPYPPLSSDGESVYLGSNGGSLVAFNPGTGQNKVVSDQVMTLGAAAICGDVAYVSSVPGGIGYPPSPSGSLMALHLSTGAIIWNVTLRAGSFIGYPTTDGRLVYSVISNGTAVAFGADSGTLAWKDALVPTLIGPQTGVVTTTGTSSTVETVTATVLQPTVVGTPPLEGGILFVTTADGSVHALNATNGKEIWTTALGATVDDSRSSSSLGYGKIFVGTSGGLYAVNTPDGSVAWKAKLGDSNPGTPTVDDGSVFVADRSGTLYQFDANSGALLWQFSGLGGGYVGEPIVADGLLVIDVNAGVFAFH
jgi:outer membrane protein assembly factor BamB